MNISCQMNSADKDSICGLHYDCDVFSPPLITHFITRKDLNNIIIWKLLSGSWCTALCYLFLVDKGQQIERLKV